MKKNGFTLVELIIAIGLAALFLPALVFVFSFSLRSAGQGENYTKAYALAQDQMEAIYFLKENDINWDWLGFPDNNSPSDYYQLVNSGGAWVLGPKTSTPTQQDGYTATVQILPVSRTAGNIADDPWSIPDPTSRKIIVDVSWEENGVPTRINLVSYVSDH